MSKEAEQAYLARQGDAGRWHSLHKPFSDQYCGTNLAAIGTIMNLLPPPPGRLLDLGCGGGWTSILYARYGYDVVGQDISQDMVDLARDNAALNQVSDRATFICSDYESLDLAEAFDCAIFFDCLHHADDELAAIRSAYAALKPGGILITHEPGEGHSTAPGSIEAMRLFGVNERDMPPHLIIQCGREVGFQSARIFPMDHELKAIFYRDTPPPLLSWKGWRLARRVIRLAFRPSNRNSAIVMLTK